MSLNVGVNVMEVDGLASSAIQGAPTSVAGFAGLAERGIPDVPVRISSLAEFQRRFGAHRTDAFLAYAVEGFFLNGGREAYVMRVVGAGSTPASAVLVNRVVPTADPALRVDAGSRGTADPGPWGNRLRIDVRDDPVAIVQLFASTAANATSAQLTSIQGVRLGSVLALVDGPNAFYRRVTALEPATRTVTWAGAIAPVLNQATTTVSTAEFRLVVRHQAARGGDFATVEDWRHLSMETDSPDYVGARLNHAFTGSNYVVVTDLSGVAPSGLENPALAADVALSDGGTENAATSTTYVGDAARRTGLPAFDTARIQLLAIPDAHGLSPAGRATVVRAALDYCAGRGDCCFVGSAPDRGLRPGVTTPRSLNDYTQLERDYVGTIRTFSAAFHGAKVFGALYAPFIAVSDPAASGPAPTRFVPPDGHVMGVYARTEVERGLWKAPAGITAQVRGAMAVSATFTEVQHTELVREGLVNGIRDTSGAGIAVAASRTLSSDTRWWFVNVRLLFNFVKASLRDGLRPVRQEPHSGELRRTVKFNIVTPFLLGLWRQGAFGSDPPEQVFTVKCDAENNPPDQVDLGRFTIEVYFYAARPAETILIVVGQQPSGATADES